MGQRGGWFPRNATDRSVRAKDPRHPGSLRTGSHNAQPAAEGFFLGRHRGHLDFARRFLAADLQAKSGVPASAIRLKLMIGSHHGILIVTPGYSASLPPLLKNAIDWVSCVRVHMKRAVRFSMPVHLRSRIIESCDVSQPG